MATSYSTILDRAQFRVSDYDALKQTFQMHYDVMRKHLMSAAADFAPYCRFDLKTGTTPWPSSTRTWMTSASRSWPAAWRPTGSAPWS